MTIINMQLQKIIHGKSTRGIRQSETKKTAKEGGNGEKERKYKSESDKASM